MVARAFAAGVEEEADAEAGEADEEEEEDGENDEEEDEKEEKEDIPVEFEGSTPSSEGCKKSLMTLVTISSLNRESIELLKRIYKGYISPG